jgi:formate dehydrogenase maturation protein FdhE
VLGSSGDRRLVCGRCQGRWPFEARRCHHCLGRDDIRVLSAHDGFYQVTACGSCKRYLKALDVRRAARPFFLPLDTVTTLALDQAVVEQGYQPG